MIHILGEEYLHNILNIVLILLGDILMWGLVNVRYTEVVAKTVYVIVSVVYV